jgi:hypothetical protein
MKIKTITANVYGEESIFDVIQYDYTDIPEVKKAYDAWVTLKHQSSKLYGRSPNIPECITETCLCLVANFVRFYKSKKLKNASFDCFDLAKEKTVQAKACSVEDDLTSFGPKTRWDVLYFLDFYSQGTPDGTFNIYEIPNDLIYNCLVKEGRTVKKSQELGYRPRIHIKSQIVIPNGIEPLELDEDCDLMEHIIRPSGLSPVEKGIKLW